MSDIYSLSGPERLRVAADMTVRLTEIKIRAVPHLCVENFARECFRKLCMEMGLMAEICPNLPKSAQVSATTLDTGGDSATTPPA
jgi:hypothetical protein